MRDQYGSEMRNDSTILLGESKGVKIGNDNISVNIIIMQNSNVERENNIEEIESNGGVSYPT